MRSKNYLFEKVKLIYDGESRMIVPPSVSDNGESRMIVPPIVSDIQSKSYIHNQLVDVAVIL
jgi:hypothetical protein